MKFRGGEFSIGTMGNFQPELTLLAESAIAGFLMGCLFPFFDAAVNSFFLKSFQPLVIPGQIILYPVLGIPCALICALVFRRYFIQHNHLPNEI